jgi:hypothetical protein
LLDLGIPWLETEILVNDEQDLRRVCNLDGLLCLLDRKTKCLLAYHVDMPGGCKLDQVKMRDRRRNDVHQVGLEPIEHFSRIAEDMRNGPARGSPRCPGLVEIAEPDQLSTVHSGPGVMMKLAEIAGANRRHTQFIHMARSESPASPPS